MITISIQQNCIVHIAQQSEQSNLTKLHSSMGILVSKGQSEQINFVALISYSFLHITYIF